MGLRAQAACVPWPQIPESQMIANVKIAIGGGINEPRDALLTILYGLLAS